MYAEEGGVEGKLGFARAGVAGEEGGLGLGGCAGNATLSEQDALDSITHTKTIPEPTAPSPANPPINAAKPALRQAPQPKHLPPKRYTPPSQIIPNPIKRRLRYAFVCSEKHSGYPLDY